MGDDDEEDGDEDDYDGELDYDSGDDEAYYVGAGSETPDRPEE